jgi:tetratricopeptide (TPR) repeat protein
MGRGGAVDIIKKVNSELASASLSYFVGEGASGSGALSSDNIIASVKRLPEKKYSDSYARSFLSFKDYVETEYSDRYLESVFLIKVFKQAGQSFIHWSVEPERMNFGMQDRTVYAAFELVLRMEDGDGKLLFERTEEIPLRMTPEQYKAHERQRFAFQDMIPAVPGEHKLLFLLKNKTGREFSSHETRLKIPASDEPGFSSLLLHHGRDPVPEAQIDNIKAFTFAATGHPVSARNEFNPSEIMGVFLQVFHADKFAEGNKPSFILEIFSLEAGEVLSSMPLTPKEGPDPHTGTSVLRADIDLTSLKPGYYRAEASALDQNGRRVLTQKEPFIILSRTFPILPWVYSRLHPPYPAFEHLRTIGAQSFLAGEYSRARDVLSRALATREDPAARLLLAKSLYGLGLYRESLDSALPLDNASADREALKVIALDYAGLGDWASALTYLERLMAEATEIGVLNLAAECHLKLGSPEKALPLLEKSLSLLPDQPPIRELRDKIKRQLGIIKTDHTSSL